MPEMRFRVRWPDGKRESCYSPSLVVKEYFTPGESYAVDEFVTRSRTALHLASDRVKARFGFACSLAMGQLDRIEARAKLFAETDGAKVVVEQFEE